MFFTASGKVVWQRFLSDINNIVSITLIFFPEISTKPFEFISRHIASKLCFSKFWFQLRHRSFSHSFGLDRCIGVNDISYQRTMKPCDIIDIKYTCHMKWGRGNIIQIVIFAEVFVTSIIHFLLFLEGRVPSCGSAVILWWSLISNFSFKAPTYRLGFDTRITSRSGVQIGHLWHVGSLMMI